MEDGTRPIGARIAIDLDPDLLMRVDAWIEAHVEPMDRAEAIRCIIESSVDVAKSRRRKRPLSGPVDAPMVRAARKMKAEAKPDRSPAAPRKSAKAI